MKTLKSRKRENMGKMATMHVEYLPVNSIKVNPHNPRSITTSQLSRLEKSIKDFPEMLTLRPLVIDKKNIVLGGNMRLQAAKNIGMEKIPVLRTENLTPEQIKEFIVKDNVAFGEWDWDVLSTNWDTDKLAEWGLDVPNFDNSLQATEDNYEIPDDIKTDIKLGDLLEIGPHRLLCGNSANRDDIDKLLKGKQPDMVFTDPPYGVSIGMKNRFLNSFQKSGRNLKDIRDDALKPEALKATLLPAFVNLRQVMSDDCTVFVTAPQGGELGLIMLQMLKEAGLPVRHYLIWKKNSPTFSMGRLDYEYQHEPILLTWGKRHKYYGKGQHRTSVWEIDKPRSSKEHPTMKPVELVANALLNNSKEGDAVLDMYMGSGTTMVAAHQLERKCYGIEIDPHYCQVIVDRMKKLEPGISIRRNGKCYVAESDRNIP